MTKKVDLFSKCSANMGYTIKFIFRTLEKGNNPTGYLYLLKIENRKKKYKSLGLPPLREKDWDDKRQRVRKHDNIDRVRNALPDIPVGYVDAYYEFADRPKLSEACDVILANCYPYWEGCHIDYSLLYMKQMYYQVKQAQPGKKIIITETGWPSEGEALGAAEPGYENALKYFINAQEWTRAEGIEMFYFSAFDEAWKVGAEGSVGAFWGLWDKDEVRKF